MVNNGMIWDLASGYVKLAMENDIKWLIYR